METAHQMYLVEVGEISIDGSEVSDNAKKTTGNELEADLMDKDDS